MWALEIMMATSTYIQQPMIALNDVDITVNPVKSPQSWRGDWAYTNSNNVTAERRKPV